jgi:hypothetical protein
MAELITERIRRNAAELRLHGVAENPDELVDAPRPDSSPNASSSTSCSNPRSGCSRAAATRPA